jgi:threonine synthase
LVPDYIESGVLTPRPSIATLASAMDVGNPSNLERMSDLFADARQLGAALSAVSIDDAAIRARIRADYARFGQVWCPHTATAAEAWARMPAERQAARRWVLVSTAHPAKFREIVEPLIGRPIEVPETLRRLFDLPASFTEIPPTLDALRVAIGGS